ncbi:hypothetical protein GLOIN_2v1668848 [Rhizophagus irregularis DAOM 181602=DAOM 197198]|uniref:Uncharacterized protein n=1 Tax=Rhizophagus irregularis (strain DAOM 181602 / DAOM 197198 / MUCL 43194) TaxID=747089 RepID=A0A2P4PIH9_RHIID|nr:hypothetical protein GLOIN_2v1668848 [Rhizophagus irregularis DAOM 181602=DAOM 197198]POG65180.1 hypothetical protein GLOIN_2v1668848 [Rhizophagus irregularis DAOM 181602=DAOM 197198]|eukprot:XP_025172046.1 hypothetical protein GLOIN_2v1668848 [Rhizophagus irregularis DAOM 181602=DAOM 197198]
MYYPTFLKVIFIVSLCFLTLNVEAQPLNGVTKSKRQLSCLPSGSRCDKFSNCCSRCVKGRCI